MGKKSKILGDILEDVVALIHEEPGLKIEKRVKVPQILGSRKREIDVLISSEVAGYPVQIVIECKNEKTKVSIKEASDFIVKLEDVGIGYSNAIMVSINGFSSIAQEKLNQKGIKTFVFEGLTEDRLSRAVFDCVRSNIYLVASWISMSMFPFLPDSADNSNGFIKVNLNCEDTPHPAQLTDVVWKLWVNKRIPHEIGKHTVFVKYSENGGCIIDIGVSGLVASLSGFYSKFTLKHATDKTVKKEKIIASFPKPPHKQELTTFISEDELQIYLEMNTSIVNHRIPVPRIMSSGSYWPPSDIALTKIRVLIEKGEEVTFEKVEGGNIMEAWRSFSSAHCNEEY